MGLRQMSSWFTGVKWHTLQLCVNTVICVIIEVYVHCFENKKRMPESIWGNLRKKIKQKLQKYNGFELGLQG
jgi:hypothetical protein